MNSLGIRDCFIDLALHIQNINADNFWFSNSYIKYLDVGRSSGRFNLDYISLNEGLSFGHFNGAIESQGIASLRDTFNLAIYQSNLKIKLFQIDNAKMATFRFNNDTLHTEVWIGVGYNTKAEFIFENCKIDCELLLFGSYKKIICEFQNCEFGPNASIPQYPGIKIKFSNCTKFDGQLRIKNGVNPYIDSLPSNIPIDTSHTSNAALYAPPDYPIKPIYLEFTNTDLSKIDFPYLGGFKLAYNHFISDESTVSNFEILLDKYKKEGKFTSYENLKIEYEQFQYSTGGVWGKVANFLDKNWWNYGFDRFKIFLWTLCFISIFFLGNLYARKNLDLFYPIYGGVLIDYYSKHKKLVKYYLKKAWRLLIITLIIFFALPLNLRSLFKFNIGFITWVLVQYLVGLWCLFFIFNFVIKLKT